MGSSSVNLFFYIISICLIRCVWSSSVCSDEADVFIKNLHFQCSPSFSPIPPLKVREADSIRRSLQHVIGREPADPSTTPVLSSVGFFSFDCTVLEEAVGSQSRSASQVDGNFLDRALSSKQRNGYASVLFYAAWCPFSHSLYPKFDILSSMFPQIEHLAVEESSASPRCAANYPALRFCLVE
ncbi:hypothetical protein Gohar_013744 [Gossypium harknessii]|uniref:Thioredoxin domain-containing protein n=1 Tax=Gossypium harknessii TaxID=34285 RepID=A0A7J9H121_9ROSI|nr:hypothetical protein [Gossypium harknessii]